MRHHEVPRKTELEKGRDRPNGWATPISSNDSFLEKWCPILPNVKESTQHCNSYLTIPLIFMWNSFVVSKFVKLSDEFINRYDKRTWLLKLTGIFGKVISNFKKIWSVQLMSKIVKGVFSKPSGNCIVASNLCFLS